MKILAFSLIAFVIAAMRFRLWILLTAITLLTAIALADHDDEEGTEDDQPLPEDPAA